MICPHSPSDHRERDDIVDGIKIVVCPYCRAFRVKDSDAWIPAKPGVIDQIRALYAKVEQSKSIQKDAMESDWNDPRWDEKVTW